MTAIQLAFLLIAAFVGALSLGARLMRGTWQERVARRERERDLDRRSLSRLRFACYASGCYGVMLPTGRASMLGGGVTRYEHACEACGATVVLKRRHHNASAPL